MSAINYSEYNNVHLPIADNLICFIKGLKHAMEKTNDPEGAMHQLKCIGFEKALETVESVAHDYKEHHKQRIRAEHEAKQPVTLAQQYPTILPARLKRYAANIQLIAQISEHEDVDDLHTAIADAIAQELELDIHDLLKAYCSRDVDAMFCALTGWDFESLMAKAKIIPDAKEYFYKPGDFDLSEIAFPLYEKEVLSEAEFKVFLRNAYEIHPANWAMIENAIAVAKTFVKDEDRADFLRHILDGVLSPMPEEAIHIVRL